MPTVTTIPATRNRHTALAMNAMAKRRVAGYARVSTDSEEQLTSYEAQVKHYENYIRSHAEWTYVNVYTDEGISGLGTKHRDGFNAMIRDALAGEIDLIVTKSVSRFARNTVDSLSTIRKLKEAGCECYFEKENIYTFDGKGELLLTIMSSLAQEESRSISENVTWSQRKRFAEGKVTVAYSSFLGYEKGENGSLRIVPEQAAIVRVIYKLFLEGKTTHGIATYLMERNIPSPTGKQKWQASTVGSILRNEKYKGDAILQKTYCVDFLTKKMKKNEGEVPQYIVEGAHEAIIRPEQFEAVQQEIARRKELGRAYSDTAFHSKLICGDCGGYYGRKVWHSTDDYRSVIYQCNSKFKNNVRCKTPKLMEHEIKERFLAAYNQLIGKRDSVIADCKEIMEMLCDTAELDDGIRQAQDDIKAAAGFMQEHIKKNASIAQSQDAYAWDTERIEMRYNEAQERYGLLEAEKAKCKRRAKELKKFIAELARQTLVLTEWDERLWITLLDMAMVYHDGRIMFRFKDGTDILSGSDVLLQLIE